MCDFVFEKMKGPSGTERVLLQKQLSEWFFKKVFMKGLRNLQKNICARKMTP